MCNVFRLLIFFFSNSSTCFGRQTPPSSGALFECIYSFWYNTPILLPTCDKVEMDEFHLTFVTGRQQYRHIAPKAVYTVKKCSWAWTSLSPETCSDVLKRSINGICFILLVAYIVVLTVISFTIFISALWWVTQKPKNVVLLTSERVCWTKLFLLAICNTTWHTSPLCSVCTMHVELCKVHSVLVENPRREKTSWETSFIREGTVIPLKTKCRLP